MIKKIGGLLIGLFALAIGWLIWNSPGETSPILASNGLPKAGSIARLEALTINGTTQWLLMRGVDSTRPVLLFLHGGPGLPETSLLAGHELEKKFVVVNWEQRGAGKSYSADVFDHSFTVSTFVNDAVAVSQWLTRRFHQPKIYLMAHSWGTFLGVLTVQKRPDLFKAYFSISQISRQLEAEQISYSWVLAEARRHGASRQVRRLTKQGPPPYPPDAWLDYLMWQRELVAEYGGGMYKSNFYPLFIRSLLRCREYTLLDKARYGLGAMETVRRLWPAVVATDLFRVAPALQVPYYLFQGTHDYQTPYPVARHYFETVQAPRKRLYTFRNSAHSPIFEEPDLFRRCLDSALIDEQAKK
ncbi:alpha/beta fold hydrolase [Spirosoma linguale]|uniref:Alpha/beta hydrolase fold protein n=1 Tax=Spirosoma linguale (strain ATCC 33905 / DSM 74 / LMG 10896 / Claus 1) TaxID=504472 RepID=D2QJV5_SPILD|nr:alpha/beta hydrolase fold protein [Spirosoma linguale DSM 74]